MTDNDNINSTVVGAAVVGVIVVMYNYFKIRNVKKQRAEWIRRKKLMALKRVSSMQETSSL